MSESVAQKRQQSSSAGRDISVAEYEECSSKQASDGCIRAQLLAKMLVNARHAAAVSRIPEDAHQHRHTASCNGI